MKVLGDGNCFFRAISKVLTGWDDQHNLLKFMAGAIGKRIVQCCDAPGYELYNTEISPPDACYDINEIRILWCSFGGDTSHPNHIVPLMKLSHGEGFNTFSRTYSGLCAGDDFSQYHDDEQSA